MTTTVPTRPASADRVPITSSSSESSTTTETATGPTGERYRGAALRRPVNLIAGVAMLATPLLVVGGILTSPPQASRGTADYIESLARDPFLSSLSANLLHYGWVAMALGLVVSMGLVRGRKGRVLTLLGGILGGFAAVQMSALMLNDWFLIGLGRGLSMPDAVRVAESVMNSGDLSLQFWWRCATLALILPVLLYAGLARAGVITWWLVPLSLFPMVAPYLVMGLVGGASDQLIGSNALGLVAGGLVGLVCYAPTFLVGIRLINRGRLADA